MQFITLNVFDVATRTFSRQLINTRYIVKVFCFCKGSGVNCFIQIDPLEIIAVAESVEEVEAAIGSLTDPAYARNKELEKLFSAKPQRTGGKPC